jgi:hypothetical protein
MDRSYSADAALPAEMPVPLSLPLSLLPADAAADSDALSVGEGPGPVHLADLEHGEAENELGDAQQQGVPAEPGGAGGRPARSAQPKKPKKALIALPHRLWLKIDAEGNATAVAAERCAWRGACAAVACA